MLSDTHILELAARLHNAAPSGSEVVLFGSYATGKASPDSDVDFLVIEPQVASRFGEMVRLRRVLKGTPVGVDILVIGRDAYAKWRQIPRSIYWSIEQEGKSLSHVA